jgi:hypothetical protein
MSAKHSEQTVADGIHIPTRWEYVDTTARDAASYTAADVGGVARVGASAPYDFYVLSNDVGPTWIQIGGGAGSGDVTGPASSNDNEIPRYNGTTGKIIQAGTSVALNDSGQIINAKTISFAGEVQHPSASGSLNIDWNAGQKQFIQLAGSLTLTFTPPPAACNLLLRILGNSTVTWPGSVQWPDATPPTFTGGGASDIVSFYYIPTVYYGQFALNFS